jgi:hypothetical protein
METWDQDCQNFFQCLFGCDIYGEDWRAFTEKAVEERKFYLINKQQDIVSDGITEEIRCTLMKCEAFCARQSFETCREVMFQDMCTSSNPEQYNCDVECSPASRPRVSVLACLSVLALVLAMIK